MGHHIYFAVIRLVCKNLRTSAAAAGIMGGVAALGQQQEVRFYRAAVPAPLSFTP